MVRKSEYPIEDLIKNRWSPRAMSGESITDQDLFTLVEAARWAPSSYNNQPWRLIFAKRETPEWEVFFDLLFESNRVWCQHAAVLIVVLSRTLFFFNDTPSRTHSFDTGAAMENLALQGSSMGLVVHAMEGFDYERTQTLLKIPSDYAVEAMFAVGKPASPSMLPAHLQERERPSDRKPVSELLFKGSFGVDIV